MHYVCDADDIVVDVERMLFLRQIKRIIMSYKEVVVFLRLYWSRKKLNVIKNGIPLFDKFF